MSLLFDNSPVLQVQGEKVEGLEIVANLKNYELTFHNMSRVEQVCQDIILERSHRSTTQTYFLAG